MYSKFIVYPMQNFLSMKSLHNSLSIIQDYIYIHIYIFSLYTYILYIYYYDIAFLLILVHFPIQI